jgi:hypothetical protein
MPQLPALHAIPTAAFDVLDTVRLGPLDASGDPSMLARLKVFI